MDIRQGDVFLKRVENVKLGKKVGTKKRTLALGEMTGHHHDLVGDVDFYETNNGLLCKVHSSAILTHQEHENIEVTEGDYLFAQQREFDLVDGVKMVCD